MSIEVPMGNEWMPYRPGAGSAEPALDIEPERLGDEHVGRTIMAAGQVYRIGYVVQEPGRTRIGVSATEPGALPDLLGQIGIETVQIVMEFIDPPEVVAEQERMTAEAAERMTNHWWGGRARRAEYLRWEQRRAAIKRFIGARVREAKPSPGYDVGRLLDALTDEDTPDDALNLVAMLWASHPLFRDEWRV
jgi:hypothetical protein